ncbi:PPC domain-containing protein [Gimesia algae]|uniref:PPC domain-containing protein n=1 Tax=Gimesia algae TaxID=2527971 RepID=UPI0011A09D9C|nr:PPC domain-containing protein [Gimesia algae]
MTIALGLLLVAPAWAADPGLNYVRPRGGQRGTEVSLTFIGARLSDAVEILSYKKGFEFKEIKANPKNANICTAIVKIAPDCALGEHTFQVRTKSGVSDYKTFWVGQFPEVAEKEPNSEFETPQPIELNHTVTGIVQNEDVDHYIVTAKKGQRISAEIEGIRLATTLFDPYIAILDEKRFELKAEDDLPLLRNDAAISVVAPADGKYTILVRDSSYGGNGAAFYRLHVGTYPRPTAVYPAGGQLGTKQQVTFKGNTIDNLVQEFQLPDKPDAEFELFASDAGGSAPSGNVFRLFPHGNSMEQEPNNDLKSASAAALPNAFNGIIEKEGDIDFFKFQAKKNQTLEIECYARRIRSPLDPVVNLYNAKSQRLGGNDDSRGPDSYFRYKFPADGEYAISITDHLSRGGEDFVYRIEMLPVSPELELGIPRNARYSQERQRIVVARGNRFAAIVSAKRSNFGGEIALDTSNFPKGIKVIAEPMAANLTTMPVVFEAAADAPVEGELIALTGRHADPKQNISGVFTNRADLVRVRNNQLLWLKDVAQIPVVVVEELPFKLDIVEPKAPLTRNGSMQLKVVVTRKEGFDEPITLQFPFRPPGVGASSRVTIPKGKNEVFYPINANSKAEMKKWKVFVIGSANVGGNAWVSSQLAPLEVADSFVDLDLARTAVEQGQETEIICKVNMKNPFDGDAKIKLVGLPPKVTTEDISFNKESKELVFKVKTDPASPQGRHKSLFCQVEIPINGENVVHTTGRTELRIDKPAPPKKDEPAKPATVAKKEEPKKEAPKRLTRLEQLRLDAQKRLESGTK